MTQEELIKIFKATLDSSSLKLAEPEDADEFISMAIDQTAVLDSLRTELGITTSRNLDTLEFGDPMLTEGVEGQAPDAADIVKPDHVNKKLQPVEAIGAVDVTFSTLRKNIMRGSLDSYLNREISKRVGKDSVLIAFSGDTSLPSTTRANKAKRIRDGFIKQAQADDSVIDHEFNKLTDSYSQKVFGDMLQKLDKDYQDQLDMLAFYVSPQTYIKYLRELGSRQTAMGDQMIFGASSLRPVPFMSIPVYPVYGMVDDHIILTLKPNLAVGWGQEITFGQDVYNRSRKIEITVTLEMDCKFIKGEALVLGTHSV